MIDFKILDTDTVHEIGSYLLVLARVVPLASFGRRSYVRCEIWSEMCLPCGFFSTKVRMA